MRYFILIIALFITTLSFSQGGKLIRIKVNKGETGATGPAGTNGTNGTNGVDGADGSVWYDGTGAPSSGLGVNGDYYLDDATGDVYLKSGGAWSVTANIKGVTGATGATGSTGATGAAGSDGVDGSTWYDGTGVPSGGLGINGDYYLNDANGDVYVKAGGSWSITANIKGLDGVGAGTVTVVTGSAPIVITSTATTTPNVTLDTTSATGAGTQYDLSLKENKLTGTSGQTLRFSGTNTVAASSLLFNNGSSIGINNTSPSGSLTVSGASYFNSQTPFNLYNAGGTGIYTSFQDDSYVDNLVYSGAATGKTFTLGYTSGGGLSIAGGIANKKLHINGGVSIGENYATNAIDANSLLVEGSFTLGTRTGTAATLASFDSGGKLVNTTLGSGFSITSGTLNNLALTSLGGQTGATQTFAYGTSGTTPSWSSASNVHTFRLPTATIGQLMVHNGTDWTAATPAYENALTFNSPLSRSVNTISIPAATTSVSGHLTSTDWNTFNGKVGGSGTSTRVAFWSGSSTLSSNANLYWDNTNSRLGIGTASPSKQLTTTQDILVNGMTVGLGGGNVSDNVTFGASALASNTSGANNIAIGKQSMYFNTTGLSNVAIGQNALLYNNANYNVAIGQGSLLTNVSGASNVGIGALTLTLNTASNNTAIGTYALQNNSTGANNTSIGNTALYNNTTGTRNVGLGYYSLVTNASGSYNVGVGGNSLALNSSGSYNVAIGDQAGYSETGSNKLYIENSTSSTPLIGGDFSTDRVGINTAIGSLARTLHVTGEVRITDLTTDTPTSWVGSDGDGDLANGSVGNGIALASGALGLTGQALAVHNLASNGLIARTSSGNVSARTITAGNGIAVTNGDGVSGNPTIVAESSQYGQLFLNGGSTVSTSATYVLYDEMSTATDDGSGNFTTNTTTGRITCNFTGKVKVNLSGYFILSGGSDPDDITMIACKNGSTSDRGARLTASNVAADESVGVGYSGKIMSVTSGDYFDVRYVNNIAGMDAFEIMLSIERVD